MPLEAYEYPKTELIVPLMALTEAQVVILYFFIRSTDDYPFHVNGKL